MARAGYCSACGNYVFLSADGRCSNGHGPEYVSNPYDVPDAGAPVAPPQPAAYQQPAYQQPAYQQPAYSAPPAAYPPAQQAPPKKKRTGLIVTLVILALLLCCCGSVGAAMFAGFIPNPLASAEHQKVAVAGDFMKALSSADGVGLAKTLPTEAAAAADPAFWLKVLAEAETDATLQSSSWENDRLTQVYKDADGTERTLVYEAIENDRVRISMAEDGTESGDAGFLTMVKEPTGYKVLALGSEDSELIRFDAESVKKLQEELQ